MSAPTDPFRWWPGDVWSAPVEDAQLYRPSEWVDVFMRQLDAELGKLRLAPITLEANRPALVVTGQAGPETLRVCWATYRDLLLFHPSPHARVEQAVDAAVRQAGAVCSRQGFVVAEELRTGGRPALLDEPSMLLHPEVVHGLRDLGLSGLPPLGVSGLVEIRDGDGATYVVATLRSDQVAVNPGCLAPTVDGGVQRSPHGIDPRLSFRSELQHELGWSHLDDELRLAGTLLPPVEPTVAAGRPTRRSGVNVVFHASVAMEPKEAFLTAPDHFESAEMVLVQTSGPRPRLLAYRDGEIVEVADVPLFSEVLAWALARSGVVDVSTIPTSPRAEPPPRHRTSEASGMTMSTLPAEPRRHVLAETRTRDLPPVVQTLDDTWADDLIERHPRLSRVLDRNTVYDVGEAIGRPENIDFPTMGPVFDAVREYEYVRRNVQVKASDEARLFEALVYRLGRYLFLNDERRAILAHDRLLPRDRSAEKNPVGVNYAQRLEHVKSEDAEQDPEGVWREEVSNALDKVNQDEAVQEYSEVARQGRLLCFCAALWILELKGSPRAADVALDDRYRQSLSGDQVALFFRARGLLVSPVASMAQTQLGLQFVTTALRTFEKNPGMHHTRALYLLRQSAMTEIEAVSQRCLEEALESVERALASDAEFPQFYATRAMVKNRLRDSGGALIDIRAAIELARYSATSPAVAEEIKGWTDRLQDWQLAPLSGGGDG